MIRGGSTSISSGEKLIERPISTSLAPSHISDRIEEDERKGRSEQDSHIEAITSEA